MERYDASRQTVRKAVAVLKTEGLLDAAQGQGVFVRNRAPLLRRLSPRNGETGKTGGFLFDRQAAGDTSVERDESQAPASGAVASRLGQWGGEPKRLRRDGKTPPGGARPGEPGTRRRASGQDRDRRRATGGCGKWADSHLLTRNGSKARSTWSHW
jgi:hypothetical protein